jgi:dimethylamine monooxygenase subunit A
LLGAAIDTPHKAARLHAAIASMSDAVLAYRSLASVRAPLLAWLESRM